MGQAQPPRGMLRLLRPTDAEALVAHLTRLDADARRTRFGMDASDGFLRRYVGAALSLDDIALGEIAFGYFQSGMLKAVAELRPIGRRDVEAVLTVDADLRGHGIGTAMFAHLVDAARDHGFKTLHMNCSGPNHAMKAVAKKFGANFFSSPHDAVANTPTRQLSRAKYSEGVDHAIFTTAIVNL